MARRKVGNPLALAVLALLAEQPRHPYDMGRTMRERHHEESIKLNYGSLYMVVEQLTRAGFIAATETVRDAARPERTVYALTEAGRTELNGWLRELLSTPHKEFRDFEAGLALAGVLPPDDVAALLRLRCDRLSDNRRRLRDEIDSTVAGGVESIFLIEDEYRLTLVDAELGFVRRLLDRIEREPDFTRTWREFHNSKGDNR